MPCPRIAAFATLLSVMPNVTMIQAAFATDPMYGKTYTVSFKGTGSFRFYISTKGELFAHSNSDGQCASRGTRTPLNSSSETSYSCPMGYGTLSVTSRSKVSVLGEAITYEEHETSRHSATPGSRDLVFRKYSFSTNGSTCTAGSYYLASALQKASFSGMSCQVSSGPPA
jgi:hypothetical protein